MKHETTDLAAINIGHNSALAMLGEHEIIVQACKPTSSGMFAGSTFTIQAVNNLGGIETWTKSKPLENGDITDRGLCTGSLPKTALLKAA